MQVHTYEFVCDRSIIRFCTYDLVLLLFITFWKNVLLTSTWILGPAYTFAHRWLIMANLILPNIIVEDDIVGDESLDDRFTRWISMMINFTLSGLGVFA